MALAGFWVWICEFLNKYPDIFPEEVPLIILGRKSYVCMAKNVKYTKHTRHISRRVNFVRSCEKWVLHNIDWCEGGLKLVDIATKNVVDNYLNPRMKYIKVILDN